MKNPGNTESEMCQISELKNTNWWNTDYKQKKAEYIKHQKYVGTTSLSDGQCLRGTWLICLAKLANIRFTNFISMLSLLLNLYLPLLLLSRNIYFNYI